MNKQDIETLKIVSQKLLEVYEDACYDVYGDSEPPHHYDTKASVKLTDLSLIHSLVNVLDKY